MFTPPSHSGPAESEAWRKGRNRIRLLVYLDGVPVSHFCLNEFENSDGFAMVHESVLLSLEKTRRDLCREYGEEIRILITGSTRTPQENEALARRLGWTDNGGAVSRTSRHLPCFHGIAVDFYARRANGERVPARDLGRIAQRHFRFVKDDYKDGHIHADNRLDAQFTPAG
jgi:hypothetical protein